MSRGRVRPTRDETRTRLFAAAAGVFAERGVSGATIEQIAAAAGFTRGAFYSNFDSVDDLLVAMLDEHLTTTVARNRELAHDHPEPGDLVAALRENVERGDDPLHRSPLLEIELMLHVARRPELRAALSERLQTMRMLVGTMAADALRAAGVDHDVEPLKLGTLLVATEDGLRLQRLMDPDSTPADAFVDALEVLRSLIIGEH